MPQPLQTMMLVFAGSVLVVEIVRLISKNKVLLRYLSAIPLLSGLAALFPYRGDLEYFETKHQVLMILTILMGILYLLEAWVTTGKSIE